jgi:capsular polysaccharide export protein
LPIQNFISPDLNGRIIAFNFPKWRQFNLKNLLTLYADKFFFIQDYAALLRLNLNTNDSILIWGNEVENELEHAAKKVKFKIIRIEDGFIRSFGLGSDLIAPTSLVFDERVLYFDATKPSTLEVILNKADFKDDDFKMAKKIKNMINHHRISKYNVNVNLRPHWKLTTKKIILVPGQVEDDASIKYGSFWIKRKLELLKEVRQRNPDSWIVYKEHPDIYIKNRKNSLSDKNILKYANYIEVEASIIDCIEASNEVHTMTSLAGFEALLRNKKVITYGEPFYAGWGLTEDLFSQGKCFKRRLRNLDINSLLIGCLLKYPIYWDPCLKGFTSCDASLEVISQKINLAKKRRPVPFFLKKLWSYQNKFTTIYNSYSQQFIR